MAETELILSFLQPPVGEMSYEQALVQLEQIVATLESDEHSLDVSIKLYERGQDLASHCAGLLDQAALKFQVLSGNELVDASLDDQAGGSAAFPGAFPAEE
jgi:exodeoxyribonuclease VII small subunit